MTPRTLAPTLLAATALALSACGGNPAQGPPGNLAAPEGEIKVTGPDDDSTVEGDEVKVTLNVRGFELDEQAFGEQAEEGRGHLHFSLDGGRYDNPAHSGDNGELAQEIGTAGRYSPATEDQITYQAIPPGRHLLVVTVANNDHSETGVREEVSFRVR